MIICTPSAHGNLKTCPKQENQTASSPEEAEAYAHRAIR